MSRSGYRRGLLLLLLLLMLLLLVASSPPAVHRCSRQPNEPLQASRQQPKPVEAAEAKLWTKTNSRPNSEEHLEC